MSGPLTTVSRELARYRLDVVCVQNVKWDKGGTVQAQDYTFFHGKEYETYQLETGFCTLENNISS
jgi:hypothetical protein